MNNFKQLPVVSSNLPQYRIRPVVHRHRYAAVFVRHCRVVYGGEERDSVVVRQGKGRGILRARISACSTVHKIEGRDGDSKTHLKRCDDHGQQQVHDVPPKGLKLGMEGVCESACQRQEQQ
jgi:hypothetical protein